MDISEVRHIALGAAIDIWGDGEIQLNGLLHLASRLEDYIVNGYTDPHAVHATPNVMGNAGVAANVVVPETNEPPKT